MKTKLTFKPIVNSSNVTIYKGEFLGCTVEVWNDLQSIQVFNEHSDVDRFRRSSKIGKWKTELDSHVCDGWKPSEWAELFLAIEKLEKSR